MRFNYQLSLTITLFLTFCHYLSYPQATNANQTQYNQAFISGGPDNALLILEKDLNSSNPNDDAAWAWVTIHRIKGDLDRALASFNGPSKIKIKLAAELMQLDEQREESEIANRFSLDYLKSYGGIMESNLWIQNTQMIDPVAGYALALSKLHQLGENFRMAWSIGTLARNHMTILAKVQEDIKAGQLDAFPATKRYLQQSLEEPTTKNLNELLYIDTYLQTRPDDGMAMRYKAQQLGSAGQHRQAALVYFTAWTKNPFYEYGLSLQDAYKSEVKAGQLEEGRKKLEQYNALYYPAEQEMRNSTELAAVLMTTGDYSAAREILLYVKDKFNQSAGYNLALGKIEYASQRKVQAISNYELAYRLGPKTIEYYDALVDGYIDNGQSAEALELIGRLEAARRLPLNYYYKKARIYEDGRDYNTALQIRKESVKVFPNSSWHWSNYAYVCAQTGKPNEAQEAILKAAHIANPSEWVAARVFDYVKVNEGEQSAMNTLLTLAKKYPWNEALWKVYASHQKKSKLEIYQQDIYAQSKNYFFYHKFLINEYIDAGRWKEAESTISQVRNLYSTPEEAKDLAYYESENLRSKSQRQKLSKAEIERAINALLMYAQLMGTKDEYWYRDMASFISVAGDRKGSVAYLDSGLNVNPDAEILLSLIRNDLANEYGVGKLSARYWQHLQRNIYDIDRYVDVIDFHVKWGGSPIAAIILSQKVKDLLPDNYEKVKNLEVMAYGSLGDNAKDFEIRYAREDVISASERYIGWYNNSRKAVWKGSAKVTIDVSTATATMQFPDGTIAQRQDDIITGKVKMIQVGNAFIKADYDQEGLLTKMESSNGKRVEFYYNNKQEISELKSENNTNLKMTYNDKGKPTRIELHGAGYMAITYDEYNEIEQVKTYDNEGKEGGTQLANRINSSFQQMTILHNALKQAHVVSQARLPDLGIEDSQGRTIRQNLMALEDELTVKPNAKKQALWFEQSVAYAKYLKDHTHINVSYAAECFNLLAATRQAFVDQKNSKILIYGPQLASLFHDLLLKTRRNGIALDWWGEWIDMQEWLQKEKQQETKLTAYRKEIENVQDKIKAAPVELLSSSEWLPKSPLQNSGYWKKYEVASMVKPEYQSGIKVFTVFKRSNGDILVGTNKGLLIRHHGYWDHVIFNPLQMQMVRKLDNSQIKASSHIQAITEVDDQLWIGTADGILILKGEHYQGKVMRRISQLDGLPVTSIDHIAAHNGKVYIGTSQGLYSQEENTFSASVVNQKVTFLHAQKFWNETTQAMEENLLVGTASGLWMKSAESNLIGITDYGVEDALINTKGDLHILQNNRIFRFDNNIFVELYGNIVTTNANQVFGLALVPVSDNSTMDDEYAVAALTDMGLNLHHRQHFEYFALPLKEGLAPMARALAGNGNGFAIYTGEEIHVYETDQIKTVDHEKVLDIITADALGITYIARSSGLFYTLHSDPQRELKILDFIYATTLALDQTNRLVTHDGARILRYTWRPDEMNFHSEELFYADQFEPSDVTWIKSGDVKNIVVAADQSIWVATKLSVFHYRGTHEDKLLVDEFNYFRSSNKFPAATHMIYRVLELPDGRIWAVASNEGHLSYNGIYLRGGLLEWDQKTNQFNLLNVNNNYSSRGFNWFLTSVTSINTDKAIVGTLGGFAEYNKGEIRDYYSSGGGLKNSSYDKVYSKFPSLFMGTRGGHLGDLWLFGSAAGVVAYHHGVWFYPDRLNEMLPQDNEFGHYGGRVVNAIATDQTGRVYVGTDLGLLIYDSRGADPVSFLMNNGEVEDAFSVQNESILQQESGPVIRSISITSPAGKLVTELDVINAEIDRLERLKADSQQEMMGRGSASKLVLHNDSITTLIANKQKQHYELLLKLEKQDPAIHQLLDVKPVEVAALRKNLNPDDCLVQYIPTAGKLYIQVLANSKMELREVTVKKDTLMKMGRYVANAIKLKMGMEDLQERLIWLYDQLLRPIENDIAEYANIMVIPVESLYYLPFAALLDDADGKQPSYAVDRFNIAYVSSTYLLGLLLKTEVETGDRYLLFGNPDGSLPGAGEEVKAISSITGKGDVFLNKQATLINFEHNAARSRIVHLATHGYLNEEAPEQSSILLADKKLAMPQIFNLPLEHTEMIVLSACETGKGLTNGMEYATIARAFANAGAPSVLATLWKVDDLSTKDLMVSFYRAFDKSGARLLSLSQAQREFIKEHPEQTHPFFWAGFILMGKP